MGSCPGAETQTDAVVVAPASALEEAEEGNQESTLALKCCIVAWENS